MTDETDQHKAGTDAASEARPGHLDEPAWLDRAVFATDGNGKPFVHEPGELIVTADTLERFGDLIPAEGRTSLFADLVLLTGVPDVVGTARALRLRGGTAQPNHVVFADNRTHPLASGVSFGNPLARISGVSFGNPLTGLNGVSFGNPFTGLNGVSFGNPLMGGAGGGCCSDCLGTYQSPGRPTDVPRETMAVAVPKPAPSLVDLSVGAGMKVLVIDTGLAHDDYRPDFVGDVKPRDTDDVDRPDVDGDKRVDTAAGHGTFIAGIIERMAPGAEVRVERMLSTFGVGDDAAIGTLIDAIPVEELPNLVNLSFSSYTEDDQPPLAITRAIQGLVAKGDQHRREIDPNFEGPVVIASAGNSGSCRKAWPAAQPEVLSVGALAPTGPAWFTNYGPWVKACAPGVDIVSRFFRRRNPAAPPIPADDDGRSFDGWAAWSGTSFSAPIVAGALLQRRATGGTLADAVQSLIHHPHLARMPALGTIVNAHP